MTGRGDRHTDGRQARPDAGSPDPDVAAVGEFPLIDAIVARFRQGPGVLLGPGDDAAVVAAPDSRVVATTDLLVDGVHFRRDWSSALDVGHKAAAQNLADVAAMGAEPTALLVGLATPPDLPVAWALELADGLGAECDLAGASVVGGDVVSSDRLTVAVTALGSLAGRAPVTRAGARPGDLVAVAGRLGWSVAGYHVLRRGPRWAGAVDAVDAEDAEEAVVAAHLRPSPPYPAGPAAARAGARAMCDVSDGLLADLGHIAAASGVVVDLDPATLAPDLPLREVAAALSADPRAWVLTGGEDHALVATFPPEAALPEGWRPVGQVRAGGPARVLVGGQEWTGPAGFAHFAPPAR